MRKSKLKKGINVLICLVMVFGLGISGIVPNASPVAEAEGAINTPQPVIPSLDPVVDQNGQPPNQSDVTGDPQVPPDPFINIEKVELEPDSACGLAEDSTNQTTTPTYTGKAGTETQLRPIFKDKDGKLVTDASISKIEWRASGPSGTRMVTDSSVITASSGKVNLTLTITTEAENTTPNTKTFSLIIDMKHVPVKDILINGRAMDDSLTSSPAFTITSGEEFDLTTQTTVTSTESPFAPTYQTINWEVVQDNDRASSYSYEVQRDPITKAELSKVKVASDAKVQGGKLIANRRGQFVLKATISKGAKETGTPQETDTVKQVLVNVEYIPVKSIDRVPPTITVGLDTKITGVVTGIGGNPTYDTIKWSMKTPGTTEATVTEDGILSTKKIGKITLRATIEKGLTESNPFVDDFDIEVIDQHIPVVGVKDVSERIVKGVDRRIEGVVEPATATNSIITWRIVDAGGTGAKIRDNNLLTTTKAGTIKLMADIYYKNNPDKKENNFGPFIVQITDAFIPVNSITNGPSVAIVDKYLTLAATVSPTNADYRNIKWSLIDAGTTGAIITGDQFLAKSPGTATVRATIENGLSEKDDYVQDFDIIVDNVFVAVTGITKVITEGKMMEAITLTGTPSPSTATNKTIIWSVVNPGTTGAIIDEKGKLTTKTAGTVVVRATIKNGRGNNQDYTKDFTIKIVAVYIPVKSITDSIAKSVAVGETITLTGTVEPENATNKTIIWSIVDAGTTKATLSGNRLTASVAGTVKVRATIKNGKTQNTDFTKDYSITIAHIPVKNIKESLPKNVLVGETITLAGTAEPENTTNKTITWSIADAGTTKATLSGNRLTVQEAGTVKVRATVKNGKTATTDFTKDYSIVVKDLPHVAVQKINNLPTKGWIDKPLQLTGTVDPANATAKTITWSIKDAGTTGATLYGSTLTAKKVGTVKLVATIENGKAKNSAYTQEFTVEMAAFGGEGATISGNKVGLYAPTGRSGIASVTVTQEAVKAALDSSPENPSVLINLKASKSAVGFSVNVEKEAVDELIARNVRTFMVKGHMGELSLSSAGLQQIRKSAKEDVNFKLTRINVAKLPKVARKKAVGKSAYALSINYYQGNRLMKINKLSLGSVLFGVPAKTNSKLKNPTIASLTNRGRVTKYKLSNYKAEEKKVFLRTKVMGNFIVTNR